MSNIKLDFHVYDNRDIFRFHVIDTSEWDIIKEKPAIIEIQTPGHKYDKKIVQYLHKNAINTFNSKSLGITCISCDDLVELEDGLYKITIKGSPDNFNITKMYIRTTALKLKIDKLMIDYTSNYECGVTNLDRLIEFDVLLKAIDANITYGNDDIAMDIYNDLNKSVDKYMNCKNCK